MTDLTGRVAVVTGSGTGVGRAIALKLAESGAKVVVNGRRAEPCDETVDQIGAENGTACAITGDVSRSADAERLIAASGETFGHVDILVNNAGVQRVSWFDRMTEDDWDQVIAVNLKGPFLCARAFVPQMRAHGYGRIINIGSEGSLVGSVGNTNYVAAKAGLMGLTMNIAQEMAIWARHDSGDYTCNLIHPGYNESEMSSEHSAEQIDRVIATLPLRRPARTRDEIGSVVAFLAGTEASYVTGAKFSAGGGIGMCIAS